MSVHREEILGDFKLVEYVPFKLTRPSYGVVALPDAGLVGVIAAWHIIKALGLKEVGGIDSYSYLPPAIVVSNKELRMPVRIFAGDDILLIYCEFTLPIHGMAQLSRILLTYFERKGVEYLLLMSGLPIQNRFEVERLRSYYVATSSRASELVKGVEVLPFENGYLVGPYALLIKDAMSFRLDTLMLLTESFLEFPDPEASARNLELLSKVINKPIDVKELLEQAELIRIRARDTMKDVVRNLAQMKKGFEYSPPLQL